MTTQPTGAAELPEALRLADAIDPFVRKERPDHLTSKVAADELRRQHAARQAQGVELEALRDRICRIGLDVDRALRGEVNTESPLGTTRLQAVAGLAQPAGAATPAAPAHGAPAGPYARSAMSKELVRLADIMRDCGRLVSKSGTAEKALRDAAAMLAAAPQPAVTEGAVDAQRVKKVIEAMLDANTTHEYQDAADDAKELLAALAAQRGGAA